MYDFVHLLTHGLCVVRRDEPTIHAVFNLHFGATVARGQYGFPQGKRFRNVQTESFEKAEEETWKFSIIL